MSTRSAICPGAGNFGQAFTDAHGNTAGEIYTGFGTAAPVLGGGHQSTVNGSTFVSAEETLRYPSKVLKQTVEIKAAEDIAGASSPNAPLISDVEGQTFITYPEDFFGGYEQITFDGTASVSRWMVQFARTEIQVYNPTAGGWNTGSISNVGTGTPYELWSRAAYHAADPHGLVPNWYAVFPTINFRSNQFAQQPGTSNFSGGQPGLGAFECGYWHWISTGNGNETWTVRTRHKWNRRTPAFVVGYEVWAINAGHSQGWDNFALRQMTDSDIFNPTIVVEPFDIGWNEWYETPMPTDSPAGTYAAGFLGRVNATIRIETPDQWQARTGISF